MSLVLVLVGTDHHPFDRIVGWADELAAARPECRVVVQHGATAGPAIAEGADFMPREELLAVLGRADVVVCHGGPGTIMDARDAGHVPVVLPRDPDHGEHVDGHQQRFVRLLDGSGIVTAAWSTDAVTRAVTAGLVERRPAPSPSGTDATRRARRTLAHELDQLCGRGPGSTALAQ